MCGVLRSLIFYTHRPIIYSMGSSVFHLSCIQPSVFEASYRMKHWDVKFRKLRARKVIKIPLPDYDEIRRNQKLSPEEIRTKMKEKGIAPPRKWNEKPIYISCSGDVFEPYIPPEGDGKITFISTEGIKQKYEVMQKKGKSYIAVRKIRNFEYDFDIPTMAAKAQEVYLESHNALAEKDEDKLHELVTEKCFLEMMENVKNKTLIWKFIQSLEQAHVVHVRTQELMSKDNIFAQATVRFHTQQTLTIYDRFGRLMYGSENLVKDVLEYVVFEKHLSNEYGNWRVHAKIIPDWMPPKDNILKTFHKPEIISKNIQENSSKGTELVPQDNQEMPVTPVAA